MAKLSSEEKYYSEGTACDTFLLSWSTILGKKFADRKFRGIDK